MDVLLTLIGYIGIEMFDVKNEYLHGIYIIYIKAKNLIFEILENEMQKMYSSNMFTETAHLCTKFIVKLFSFWP